jgi:hypothetical protein
MTVYRRDEKPMRADKTEEKHEVSQEEKKEIANARPWIAFDGLTEMWMWLIDFQSIFILLTNKEMGR